MLGHSTGGGAAVLAAAKDDQIKAVVTVTAAETSPSAIEAAGRVEVPSLHLIGVEGRHGRVRRREDRPVLHRAGTAADGQGQPAISGWPRASRFVNGIIGADSDKRVQQVTRMLASAFFIRHLTDADQLADELENKVKGTTVEDLRGSGPAPLPTAGDLAAAAAL